MGCCAVLKLMGTECKRENECKTAARQGGGETPSSIDRNVFVGW